MAATHADLDRCAKLMALVSSDAGDGSTAARKLREKMDACRISFDHLYRFIDRNESHAFVYARFTELKAKCQAIWKSDDDAVSRAHESDPDWTWIPEHSRRTKSGRVVTVSGYWRHTPRKKTTASDPWRYDRNATPGDGYRWIEPHERHHAHNEVAKRVPVRGHWRKISAVKVKQAA